MTLSLPSFTRSLGRAVSLLLLLLGAGLLTQAQSIRYVKPAVSGNGSGSSWANASGNLQAMINASVATDQVWVAAGTYKPTTTTDRAISFSMKDGVAIYGGFAGTETSLSQRPAINLTTPSSSILSGDLGTPGIITDNSYHVISNPTTLVNTAVLDGFIITGGNANGGSSAGSGGGMFNPGTAGGTGASPTVRNCSFQGNSASIGGAFYIYNVGSNGNSTLTNCSFGGNSATTSGGAIFNYRYSGSNQVMLTNCSFQGNSAATSGGAIFNVGETFTARPVLTNCSFQNNSASQGGAVYNDGTGTGGNSRPQLINCVLFGNGGSNSIRNSPNSYVEALSSLFEAGAAFTPIATTDVFYNVGGVTVNPFASTSSVALNACAPAIDRGYDFSYNNINGPSTDLAGNARFYGGRIDMGAVEFQGAPSTITITPPGTSTVIVGTAYNQAFSASGGSGSYSLLSGSLPPGITLAMSGVLSGTPTQVGRFSFTVRIMDPVTGCWGDSEIFTISVRSDKPIRYVKAGGTGNGDSWANASGNLQSQIDLLGTEKVWVAAGTYKPATTTDRTISFAMRPGVEIYGGFVGNETALGARPAINPVRGNPSTTILSGDIGVVGNNADNSYHVILNRDGLTSTAILDGFVITGGNANEYSYEGGGGMANISRRPAGSVSPTVRNCSFLGNTASNGGAIFNDASPGTETTNAYPQTSSPTLINCVFRDNSATAGGAVSNNATLDGFSSSPQFDNCQFINNTAANGGAIDNSSDRESEASFRLTNCLFQGNTADIAGGAINNSITTGGYSIPVLTNCSFQGNSIKQDARDIGRLGGALYFSTSGATIRATLTNCSFQGNTAANAGGAVYAFSQAAQGFSSSSCTVYLISSVVFGNGGNKTFAAGNNDAIYAGNSLLESSATNYYDYNGLNNILTSTSPFASSDSPALAANSPAINAANSSVQGTDVAGNPRIVGCRIDMGAYEFQYDPAVAITAQPAASSVVCGRASVSVPVGVSGQYLTYQWYKDSFANPVTGQTSATLSLTNVQPANAGSYSLVVTGNCNSLTSTAFTLTVNQPAVSISPGSATICQGKSVLLTASGASTYTWSNTTMGNTLSATTAGAYSVTGVDGNGCSNFATAIVTENKPTVSINPVSATICPGKSVLLTASGASTYTWSNTTTDNPLTATTAGTYSVTGVDGNGCFNTARATITENKPTVSISPNPASICQASSVLLTASGASTYTWSNNTTGNTLSATTVGTYSVTGVAANGCFNSATATVTDNRPIVSITATPSATVVQGASITLTASGTGATSFAWSSGSTSNLTVINPATSAPYSVTVRNAAGCVTVASLNITVTSIVCGPVIYVTQTGSGQRDGSSWANALGSSQLQSGINAAAGCGGDRQVWVAAGTYKPTTGNDRSASFALRNGVSVYGGFVGNETALTDRPAYNPVAAQPSSTTLSGDIGTLGSTSDNSFRVINNPASLSLTNSAVLDGFVIMGGAGGTLGGGMFNDGSSPTLRNCSFVNNSVLVTSGSTSRGGAIYNGNGSSPQLTNCRFEGNSVLGSSGNIGYGGAISNFTDSSPLLVNCSFLGNSVSGSSNNFGGAMANNVNSNPQLINCSFVTNSAVGGTNTRGGAMNNGNGCNPQLINCSFLSNSVSGGTTTNQGGAITNATSSAQLTNCVVFGNGGSNTFYNFSSPTSVSITATYSLFDNAVTGYTDGPTNLTTTVSPFLSATDARLNGCSPAVNTGDNGANTSTTDLDGNPRVYQNGRIDMGAYEYQGAAGVAITNPTVSTATVGVAFSQNFTASGGSAGAPDRSYSYSLASGSLPPGLSLSNTGVLSGTPTQTGSFTITVSATNASSCLGVSAPYVLTVNDAASSNPTLAGFTASPGAVCAGSVDTFTATVGNVTGSYNYTLTNGLGAPLTGSTSGSPFSQSITASGTGTQSFTLTVSANGQSTASVTTLTVNPLPVASLINNGPLTCAQSSVTLTASGAAGVPGSSYTFASGSGVLGTPGPINTVVVSASGIYSVTVASASGCVSTTSTVVTADQNVPTISISSSSTTLSCASSSVSLTAIGTGSVRWSTGETTPVISVTTAATYSVTLTSANGCSAVASTSVNQDNTAPVASLASSGSLTCSVTSVTLTANPAGLSYVFSGPGVVSQSGNTAVVNTSGLYSVTVVSGNGCSSVANVSVSQDNSTPTASISPSSATLSCASPSVSLTAIGTGSVRWSTGETTPVISVTTAATYSVTLTSANGCSAVASTSVSQDNTAPVASLISSGSLTCSVTSVTLTANPAGLSYIFSGPGVVSRSGNTAIVNASGLYSVTVVNANGCSSVASVSVSQDNTAPTASISPSSATLSCASPSVSLTAIGTGSVRWSTGEITPVISVTTAATYSVTLTSANGCSAVASISVAQNNTAPVASLISSGSLTCAVTSATLTASPGGQSYVFSSGATQIGISNQAVVNASGTYSVTVVSANGCSSVASISVSGNQSLPTVSINPSSATLNCASPTVTLTANGTGTVRWSTGQTTPSISVTTAGIYSVTVVSTNGCTVTASTTVIGDVSVPTVDLTNNGPLSCSATSVTLTASGGGTYRFSSGATQVGNGPTATVSSAGVYSVTVISSNGCTAVASTTVTGDQTAPTVSINPSSATLTCASPSVSLTVVGNGSVRWDDNSTNVVRTVSTSGIYSVTLTGANGCVASTSATVTASPASTATISGSLTVCPGQSTILTASGGSSYRWSTGETTASITAMAGTYSVTVSNGSCSASTLATVSGAASPTATISGTLTVVSGGTTTLTATGGSSLTWSTGQTTASITVPAGAYSVTVASGSGCTSTTSVTVTTGNTAPTVANAVSPQSATVGVAYTLSLANTFADAETPNNLTLTTVGLPTSLSLNGTTISGTPSTTVGSPYSVTITATDPGGLSGRTVFVLSVSPAASVTATAPFAITGVTTIDCTPLSNRTNITFNPRYAGLDGTPVSFQVLNELAPTTNPGPYSLTLYPDNPVITLRAIQSGVSSSFTYNWLTACNSLSMTPGGNTPPTVANAIPPQSATVGQGFSYVIPANTFTDAQTPNALTLSVTGLPTGLSFTAPATISGTPLVNGVSSVTVTATDPGGLSGSTRFVLTVSPAVSTTSSSPFAITGVMMMNCTPVANRVNISFNPQYAGLNGSPVSFQVVNELAPTTDPGPYSLSLYPDNPVITLKAIQSGVSSSFTYNWLTACNSLSTTPGANTGPTVANAVSPQSATVGVGYTLSLANTFTDAQTPNALVLSVAGLPMGLSLSGTTISGTPSMSGTSTVTVTATDPGNLSVSTTFTITVSPASTTGTPTGSFALTGVTTGSCTVLAPGQRSVTFNPRYVGLDGTPVSFQVVNELAATTNPGPYTLALYTDNPVITLRAVQSGVSSTFTYNWLEACRTLNIGSRQASSESMADLSVRVLGNPVPGETVSVEIRGGEGQRLQLTTTDSRGRLVSEQTVTEAKAVETQTIRVGSDAGVYILQVSTPTQVVTTKIMKR